MTQDASDTLPSLPPPPSGLSLIIFSPAAWTWIVQAIQLLYAAEQAQFAVLGPLVERIETLMATIADLSAAVATLTANDSALATEVGALHTAVENLITAFDAVKGGLSAADQATLDAATQGVVNAAIDLATQTGMLSSTGTDVGTANPPKTP